MIILLVGKESVYIPSDIVIRVNRITDINGIELDLESSHYHFTFFVENDTKRTVVVSYDGVNRVNSIYDKTSKMLLFMIKGTVSGQPVFSTTGALKYQQMDTFSNDVIGDTVRYFEYDSGITIKRLTNGSR